MYNSYKEIRGGIQNSSNEIFINAFLTSVLVNSFYQTFYLVCRFLFSITKSYAISISKQMKILLENTTINFKLNPTTMTFNAVVVEFIEDWLGKT